jgi:hypothetical protein
MGSKLLRWLLVVLVLGFASTAKADTVTFDGGYAFGDNGYGIPPYSGTLNTQAEAFYCVDFTHEITAGESWNVTVSSLTGSNFSSTRLFASLGSGAQMAYLEMAYLITQMMSATTQLQKAEDQYAIWSFTGGPNPYGTNSSIVAGALAAVKAGFTGEGFEILTPTGTTGQEFLIYVAEPSELLMLLIGLGMMVLALKKKKIGSASPA